LTSPQVWVLPAVVVCFNLMTVIPLQSPSAVVLKVQVLPSAVEKDMVVVAPCTQVVAQVAALVQICSPAVGVLLDQE
jgi:hypothetical protein